MEEALARATPSGAAYVSGLVAAGVRSGRLAEALERHLFVMQRTRQIRSRILLSLGYPLLLGLFALTILWAILVWPVQDFKEIFEDFQVPLPSATITLIGLSDVAVRTGEHFEWFLLTLVTLAAAVCSLRFLPGRAWRVRMFQWIPSIGSASRHAAVSEFCSLLSILTACDVPLPEALRMTASALRDANLREGAARLADEVEKGASAEDEVRALPYFSKAFSPLFRWADRHTVFSESLRTAGELHAAQARLQAGVVGVIVQPFLLFLIAVPAIGGTYVLFMPLVALLQSLT